MKSERKETLFCATQMSLVQSRLFLRGLVDRCFHVREREQRERAERERHFREDALYTVFLKRSLSSTLYEEEECLSLH